MAKRKRISAPNAKHNHGLDVDPAAAKLKFNSYEDLADSEDEFHINRDKILLEGKRDSKRVRQAPEEPIELSEEEVLPEAEQASSNGSGYSDESDGDAYDDEDAGKADDSGDDDRSESVEDHYREVDDDLGNWGPSKSDYYNADRIENEQDALDEEAEAKRIQQKRLKSLSEADFGFDEAEWLGTTDTAKEDHGIERAVVTEVLPQLRVTDEMSIAERLKLLNSTYPEFALLSNEFWRLEPLHVELETEAALARERRNVLNGMGRDDGDLTSQELKHQTLSAYLGALAMYFAIFTSNTTGNDPSAVPIPARELREHNVMTTLFRCRGIWQKVKDLSENAPEVEMNGVNGVLVDSSLDASVSSDLEGTKPQDNTEETLPASRTKKAVDATTAASEARRAKRLRETEDSIEELNRLAYGIFPRRKSAKSTSNSNQNPGGSSIGADVDSDIGDEPELAPQELEEKARRKKSLRFYTSQIAQKANKRANAGRAMGGDDDLPRRERLRDRQERLTKEAERRARKTDQFDSTALNSRQGEDEAEMTNVERAERERTRAEQDAEEDALEARVLAKKAAKQKRQEVYRQAADEGGRVVKHEKEEIGPDGRRQIGYAIEKNKGLTPRRKKEVKNPRVKKRKRFEDKTKKLKSMKPTYQGGEGRGGYGGELTGIKKGLVRSTKL